VVEKSNGLYGFAESHLICEDGVFVLIPALNEPVETLELKVFEFSVVFEYRDIFFAVLSRCTFLSGI
jgi:hypothetical protein